MSLVVDEWHTKCCWLSLRDVWNVASGRWVTDGMLLVVDEWRTECRLLRWESGISMFCCKVMKAIHTPEYVEGGLSIWWYMVQNVFAVSTSDYNYHRKQDLFKKSIKFWSCQFYPFLEWDMVVKNRILYVVANSVSRRATFEHSYLNLLFHHRHPRIKERQKIPRCDKKKS